MQASLNQLAEILAERAGKQYDIPFKEEMKVIINYWRGRLMVDSLNARPQDRKFFTKWLDIPLIEVPQSEFPGFPNCTVLRTECKLPKTLRANSTMYDFVGKLDRMTSIPVQEPYIIKAMLAGKYSGKIERAAEMNGYIYVYNNTDLPGISVNSIPESIIEFENCCKSCSGAKHCYNDDEPYPVSDDIKQRIIQAILATELRLPTVDQTKQVSVTDEQQPIRQ